MRRLSAAIGRPVSFALTQNDHDPDSWRRMLELAGQARAEGARVRPQVAGRPVTLLLGLETFHPFAYCPSWAELGLLPARGEGGEAPRRPGAARPPRSGEAPTPDPAMLQFLDPAKAYPLGDPPDYEPAPSDSVAARAPPRPDGTPTSCTSTCCSNEDGRALVMRPLLNYTDANLDAVREMLLHPTSAWGLGDGGAHCGTTCDASTPTFMLTHWARDRDHDRLPLEWVVRKMTAETASLYGLGDRGTIEPGKRADLNVIDHAGLRLHAPEMVYDLPGDARRFVQRADGYVATVVAGEVTFEHGEDTGARPGPLIRGARGVAEPPGGHALGVGPHGPGGIGAPDRPAPLDQLARAGRARRPRPPRSPGPCPGSSSCSSPGTGPRAARSRIRVRAISALSSLSSSSRSRSTSAARMYP